MFRFKTRDLLWLTLAVGLIIGWWIDHRSDRQAQADLRQKFQDLAERYNAQMRDAAGANGRLAELEEQLKYAQLENARLLRDRRKATRP